MEPEDGSSYKTILIYKPVVIRFHVSFLKCTNSKENLEAMASNLEAIASNLRATASNLEAMASNRIAMASNILQPNSDGLQPNVTWVLGFTNSHRLYSQ